MTQMPDCVGGKGKAPILDDIRAAIADCGVLHPRQKTKLTGATTVEVIRSYLNEARIPTSPRDVYLSGIPTEFDLLAVRPSSRARCGIIYDPADVAAVLEVKFSGAFSKDAAGKLEALFEKIKERYGHIQSAYITVRENPRYKYRITSDSIGFKAFTLYWVEPP